jgi:DHA1 family multidrug resistance protein-like MFS transporter
VAESNSTSSESTQQPRSTSFVLFLVIVAQSITFLSLSFAQGFLPFYLTQDLGVEDDESLALWIGATSAVGPLMVVLWSPLWGVLSDRFGQKPMMVRALVGSGLLLALNAAAQDPWQFLVIRTLSGIATGVNAPTIGLISVLVPRERLGRSLSWAQTGRVIGMSIGPVAGGVAGDLVGFRAAFLIAGAIALAASALLIIFVPNPQAGERRRQSGGLLDGFKYVGANPQLTLGISLIFLGQVGDALVTPFIPVRIRDMAIDRANLASLAGLVVSAGAFSTAFGGVLAARWAESVGFVLPLTLAAIGGAILQFAQAYADTPEMLFVLRLAMGLVYGGTLPLLNAIAGVQVPADRRGVVFGVTTSANAGSNLIGPLIGSALFTYFDFRAPWVAGAGVMLLSAVLIKRGIREPAGR